MSIKKEASVVGGIKGFQASGAPVIKRKMKEFDTFDEAVAQAELEGKDVREWVRKIRK